MKGGELAVCSREEEYVRRFAEYANRRKESLFAVHGFTNCAELALYTKEHAVDILLLEEGLLQELPQDFSPGKVILLSEQEYRSVNSSPAVYKYQSCACVLRQAMDLYAEQTEEERGIRIRPQKMKKIGIYSPVGRTGKTDFALSLGREAAKRMPVLYLNMEEYSGFSVLYPYGDGLTLSELMYFLKQGKKAFACKLESIVQQMGALDYIPPLRSPVELRHISLKDWEALLEALDRESPYELVILDLSGAVNGLFDLLRQCDFVYMPVEQDERARAKLVQYEDTLALLHMEEIMDHTRKLCFSDWSEAEACAREEGRRWNRGENALGGASQDTAHTYSGTSGSVQGTGR